MELEKAMKLLISITVLLFSLSSSLLSTKVYGQTDSLDLNAEAAMVVDTENGQILYQSNPDEVRAIASLTKMMVQYIVLEEINEGTLSWDESVEVSPFLEELSVDFVLANVPLSSDETYTVKELYDAMSIYSANAATIALAEHIEGSEEAMVHRMRDLVADFGIEDAHIVNTTGLHNSYMHGEHISDSHEDDENLMSARSVMIISMRLVEDYPEILETAEEPSISFRTPSGPFIVPNWNKMLPGLPLAYPGVRGLKTGTTQAAGQSFTGYVESNSENQPNFEEQPDRSIITIVLHAGRTDDPSVADLRYHETAELMDFGLQEWQYETLFLNEQYNEESNAVSITDGQEDTIALAAEDDVEALVHLDEIENHQLEVSYNPEKVGEGDELMAPVYVGDTVGEVVITFDEPLEFLESDPVSEVTVPVYATETVEQESWFLRQWDKVVRQIEQWFN